MPNDALRQAMTRRALSPQQLAEAVGVDAKTVSRWLTDDSRLPHPRHRWLTAETLEVEEHMIWPRAVRATIKTGADREIISCYPCRSAVPHRLWVDLITGANGRLIFGGYTSYFLWLEVPNLGAVLREKINQGADIRFLLGDPGSPVTAERDRIENVPLGLSTRINVTRAELAKLPALPVRYGDRHIGMSVWVFDDQMIVSTHIADRLGHDSPTLHIQRKQEDGLYDRYHQHIEHLWGAARFPTSYTDPPSPT